MQSDISLIKDNLLEIYSTLDQGEELEKFLVGSLWGKRLYNTQSGWGKLWQIVYLLAGKRLRTQKLQEAILKTQQVFDFHCKMIEEAAGHYSHYIVQKSLKASINEEAYLNCRHLLTKWFEATDPFLCQVYGTNPRLQNFLKRCLNLPPKSSSSFFQCRELHLHIKQLQYILEVEGLVQGPLPYSLFYKLSLGQELVKEEKVQLYKWIRLINDRKNKINIHPFHRFLKSLVEEWGRSQILAPSLEKLEMSLVESQCCLFSQEDLKHLAWRNQLKSGDTLFINGKPIVLGEKVGEKRQGFDRNIHFAIQGEPQKLVTISLNEAVLGIRKSLEAEQGYALKMPTIFEIEATGAYAIVERLTTPLDLNWKSQRDQFSKEDEEQVGPLATLLLWLAKQQVSAAYLSPRHLMFSEQGELKTLKLILKTKQFEFNALQAFVLECAAGNIRVFQHLMEISNLRSHACAKFYERVVRNTLKESSLSIERLANQYAITDSLILERAVKLAQEVKQLHRDCMDKIRVDFPLEIKEADLSSRISKEIVAQYNYCGAAGIIWPNLGEFVHQNVKRENRIIRLKDTAVKIRGALSFN